MGQNLALNIARAGFPVTIFDRSREAAEATLTRADTDRPMLLARTPEQVTASLARPRKVLLLIKAGQPVDDTIAALAPTLQPGDLIIDGGNTHPDDTARRAGQWAAKGLGFVGMGVSGGAAGALDGPSLMPGCERADYDELHPILSKIAAQVEDGPCVTHVGKGAAGHFVKVVHNGIEYGDMQLIAECFDLMQNVLEMSHTQMADTFAQWNDGPLESFLIAATADILRSCDPATNQPILEVILDRAGEKGTGRWAAELALRHGVPAPTLHAAVQARGLSSQKERRVAAARHLRGPEPADFDDNGLLDAIRDALYCSRICCYAQGLDLMATAEVDQQWGLDLAEIARIWKGGCIIRAGLLDRIHEVYANRPATPNLLLDDDVGDIVGQHQGAWRRVVALGAARGIPMLAMTGSLGYFDSLRRDRLPQNLTQAQRDLFGAHGFERADRPTGELFRHDWPSNRPPA